MTTFDAIFTFLALMIISAAIIVWVMLEVERRREQSIRRWFTERDAEWRERRDHE